MYPEMWVEVVVELAVKVLSGVFWKWCWRRFCWGYSLHFCENILKRCGVSDDVRVLVLGE